MVFPIESTHGVVRQKWVGLIFLQDAVAVALALLTLAHGTGRPTGRLSPAGKRRKTDTDRLDHFWSVKPNGEEQKQQQQTDGCCNNNNLTSSRAPRLTWPNFTVMIFLQ